MTMTQTAGADAGPQPVINLRQPTFADWLVCGDIERQTILNPRGSGEVAVEFRTSAMAVALWFARLSGMTPEVLRRLPFEDGRRAYRELQAMLPTFDAAKSGEDGSQPITVALSKALPGHREEHTTVTLRVPEIGDWIDCGDLYVQRAIDPGADNMPRAVEMKLSEQAVGMWMQRLTGLPIAVLGQMAYVDARAVFAAVKALVGDTDSGNSKAPLANSGSSAAPSRAA